MTFDAVMPWIVGVLLIGTIVSLVAWSLLRKPKELPEPTRRPGQDVAEEIVRAYLAELLGRRFNMPRTIWNDSENRMVTPELVMCSTWEGYVHECLHAVRAQFGVIDPAHTRVEDWGTIVDGKWQFDKGHNVEMQRRVREAGFVP